MVVFFDYSPAVFNLKPQVESYKLVRITAQTV